VARIIPTVQGNDDRVLALLSEVATFLAPLLIQGGIFCAVHMGCADGRPQWAIDFEAAADRHWNC
jgi:hypothetical protein